MSVPGARAHCGSVPDGGDGVVRSSLGPVMSQPAFDFPDAEPDTTVADLTMSVSELAEAINEQLRHGFGGGVWVRGEIAGLKRSGPHIYFSLVEGSERSRAKIDVKLFAPAIKRLTPALKRNSIDLRDGLNVRLHGYLDFWAQGGSVGLKMDDIDPAFTLGDIAQSRDQVLRRLVAGGLVDLNRQHPMPAAPLRVGVVTSLESAGWADFRHELEASGFAFHLTVADTRVQGDGVERHIAGAIGTLARGARAGILDVIVVIRGGGARTDLAVFDSEIIARTITEVPIPVLTGLGHEIDRSIADEVAHTALKTPTACAGALISRVAEFTTAVDATWQAIVRRAGDDLARHDRRLLDVSNRIVARTQSAIDRSHERLDHRRDVLCSLAPSGIERASARLDGATTQLLDRTERTLERATSRLDLLAARVAAVDPAVQLARGWSITRDHRGAVIRSVDALRVGTAITTTFIDGETTSVVDAVRHTTTATESDADDD
jgi:exodeoxyribonuclease VII large subunit